MNVHGKPQICISKTIEQLHFNSDHHGESYFYFYGRWLILFGGLSGPLQSGQTSGALCTQCYKALTPYYTW